MMTPYVMTTSTTASAASIHSELSHTAKPTTMSAIETYMGLRVNRYGPPLTIRSDGCRGSTFVPAFPKVRTAHTMCATARSMKRTPIGTSYSSGMNGIGKNQSTMNPAIMPPRKINGGSAITFGESSLLFIPPAYRPHPESAKKEI